MPRIDPVSVRRSVWRPNIWDAILITIVFGCLAALAWATSRMADPFNITQVQNISLSITVLPAYAARTVLRMFCALVLSLLFTFLVAPLAARNTHFERFMIPFIDIMESIPILSFLAISVVGFINLFPQSMLGPECAAIFAIFTSQVWNMTLSLYQSLKTIPKEFNDVADSCHLSPWQRFWKIDVPYSIPQLVWNTMISMSAGWFFVVASEAFAVNGYKITLPGIGSYIHIALRQENWQAIGYAIVTMFGVIVLYDQLLFRPILSWAEKYDGGKMPLEENNSWFYNLLARARFTRSIQKIVRKMLAALWSLLPEYRFQRSKARTWPKWLTWGLLVLWYGGFVLFSFFMGQTLWQLVFHHTSLAEFRHVVYLGLITALRIGTLLILASLVWTPIGVWIGLRPKLRSILQPVSQFLAAFPANLLFPVFTWMIIQYRLDVNIWTAPLIILGPQWYILFNIIAGASALPKDIQLATHSFHLHGWLWWKRLILPVLFPYYVTGAMAAAGGCWNASVVAEVVVWGNQKLVATGLGAYITENFEQGDFNRVALGTLVMGLYVIGINKLVWHRLYHIAESRFALT